ncbi:VOC family protein [Tepidicaulis sp. LMO-SS28]|uniref:VOC family protein n=1 Tax=Tepidicaulis sp. LMO-SS28 TaxID=3447455 RepID=UPI003EE04984
MDQRLSVFCLGTGDMARARRFYEGLLGWTPQQTEGITAYYLGGMMLAIAEHGELAGDAELGAQAPAPGYRGFTLAHNVASEQEVDALLGQIGKEGGAYGAALLKPATRAPWGGYSGYFTDPDGNAWEVCFNPFWPLDAEGRINI